MATKKLQILGKLAGDGSHSARYNSIEDALSGQNVTPDGKVATHIVGDALNIILLDDIESATTIDITKNCTLHLNGKTLEFTEAGAHLNINTASEVTINGKVSGSEITKDINNGTNEKLVSSTGTALNMVGGTYSMYGTYSTAAVPVRSENETTSIKMSGCTVTADASGTLVYGAQFKGTALIDNCSFSAINNGVNAGYTIAILSQEGAESLTVFNSDMTAVSNITNSLANGISVYCDTTTVDSCTISVKSTAVGAYVYGINAAAGTTTVTNCHIEADGYGDLSTNNEDVRGVCAIQGVSGSSVTINGGYYYGAREALSLFGTARINGGVYEGCQHGGAYLGGTDIKVKNATFRNIEYTGDCGWNDTHFGAVFCGGSAGNANVSFDNCRFEAEARTAYTFTAKYTNTKVYLSNSVIEGDCNHNLRADSTCTIYIGKNVSYDVDKVGVSTDPDNTVSYRGTIDTATYADQEFGFETEPTDCENLVGIKIGLLQKQLDNAVKGKAYELIETITLEEKSTITRSQEPDGTPYNFKQMYLALKTNAQGTPGWLLFKNGVTTIGGYYMGGGKADVTSYNAVEIRLDTGFWRTTWNDWGTNNLVINAQCYANERDYYPIKGVDEYPAITSVILQAELTAGTEMQIWGVRADA